MTSIDDINRKIKDNWDEEIDTLKHLISIRSVAIQGGAEGAPFGEGVSKAFGYMLEKGAQCGFTVKDVDGYGGHIELACGDGEPEGVMGIVCHLDTVPEGTGWDHDPFACEEEDGRIYGRGTTDDKGPAIAAFFAMKAISDAGIVPKKKIRLILGLDEESEWNGMNYYNDRVPHPDFGFTPDAEFPAINGEMGILIFDIAKKFSKSVNEGLELRSLTGGNAPNMVADSARAVVRSKKGDYEAIKQKASKLRSEGVLKVYTKNVGKSLEIKVEGISAHGARPATGKNAISGMFRFFEDIKFSNDDINEFIEFYNRHIGFELNGESLGCRFEDEESGETILNVGMVEMDTKAVRLTVNIRFPVTSNYESVYRAMEPVCSKYDLGVVKKSYQAPVYISKDDEFIKTLMDIYREHTGDVQHGPIVIGGGTYARAFSNVVAFGQSLPGERECAHQKNEFITKENLMLATSIYADAILRLCC